METKSITIIHELWQLWNYFCLVVMYSVCQITIDKDVYKLNLWGFLKLQIYVNKPTNRNNTQSQHNLSQKSNSVIYALKVLILNVLKPSI